ncbi:MAG: hypothetical protein K2M60_08700 [Lachnospiraceae bacterium]|nr:hypothetical protein [Lachnospiraceae bacterium]
MLDSVFSTAADQSVSISYQTALIAILTSLILGLVISFIYMYMYLSIYPYMYYIHI